MRGESQIEIQPYAKRSVAIFLATVIIVMFYATLISKTVGLVDNPVLPRNEAIISFMLGAAALIVIFCKIDISKLPLLQPSNPVCPPQSV